MFGASLISDVPDRKWCDRVMEYLPGIFALYRGK